MAPSALMPRHAKADPHAHGCCAKGKSEAGAGGGGGEGGGGSDVRGFQLRRQLAWQNVNELGPMTYEVPQGAAVAEFLELYGPDCVVMTNLLWGKVKHYRELARTQPHPSNCTSGRSGGGGRRASATSKNRYDDIRFLHGDGLARLAALEAHAARPVDPIPPVDRQAFSAYLHCAGADHRSGPSGSNCFRDPCRGKWCASETGVCDPSCVWAQMPDFKRSRHPQHRCRMHVRLTATVSQVARGVVTVQVVGAHTAEGVEWRPVASDRLTPSVFAKDAVIRAARAGPVQRSSVVAIESKRLGEGAPHTTRVSPKRTQASALMAYDQRVSRGPVCGAHNSVDAAVRLYHLSMDDPLPPDRNPDGAQVIYYTSQHDGVLQLVVATEESLANARAHGCDQAFTDSKHDLASSKPATTPVLCAAPGGGTLPLAISVSTVENEVTTECALRAVRDAVPCSDPSCSHPWEEHTSEDCTVYRRYRPCALPCPRRDCPHAAVEQRGRDGVTRAMRIPCAEQRPWVWTPQVGIDKSASSRDAIKKVGMMPSVCFFHNIKALVQNLRVEKRVPTSMHAAFERAVHVLIRAQSARQYQLVLRELLKLVGVWAEQGRLAPADTEEVLQYLWEELGAVTLPEEAEEVARANRAAEVAAQIAAQAEARARAVGTRAALEAHLKAMSASEIAGECARKCSARSRRDSRWAHSMGDFIADGIASHQITNNSAESHFRLIDRCIFQDVLSGSLADLVEIVLGVDARGQASRKTTYWGFFRMQREEREWAGGAKLKGDVLHRSLEGRWLSLMGHVEAAEEGGREGLYRVKAGVDRITRSSAEEERRRAARRQQADGGGGELRAQMRALTDALLPPDLPPPRDGWYTVDAAADICYLCEDYLWAGNRRGGCRHLHAVRAHLGHYGDAASQAARISQYCWQVERRKQAWQPRDPVLYQLPHAPWEQVRERLLLPRDQAESAASLLNEGTPVEYAVTIPAGVKCNVSLAKVPRSTVDAIGFPAGVYYHFGRGRGAEETRWSPALRVERGLIPQDIILSVCGLPVDSPQRAQAAQVLLDNAAAERVLAVVPVLKTMSREAPTLLANARQPGAGRAFRRKGPDGLRAASVGVVAVGDFMAAPAKGRKRKGRSEAAPANRPAKSRKRRVPDAPPS
ncbi:hypothetical protein JKP88DRAFT_241339 [Tribonema minus]|uniref:Uncharacterized protein n=1 Tax=Tribonema minus TaxID=303371 RepID=A0A835YYN2_9STRA|nr:hypothetical protein JKP88DRAFT_241339 [Tribonema minus]